MKLTKCHYLVPRPIASPQTYNQVQLWNPSGSGVDLCVSLIEISSRIGGRFNLIVTDAAIGTLRSKGCGRVIGPTEAACKAIGEGEWREGNTQNWGSGQIYSIYVIHVQPDDTYIKYCDLVVTPGWGIVVVATADQDSSAAVISRGHQDMAVNFDWEEIYIQTEKHC